jgi:hypothetical protein
MAKGDTSQKANTQGQNDANEGKPRNEGWESIRSDDHNKSRHAGYDSVTEKKK